MCELKAWEAKTVIGAHGVLTCPISTRLSLTLIDVHTHGEVSRGLKTIVAQTAVAALRVDAFTMAAHIGDFQTFITVHARSTGGQLEARRALAAETSRDVVAVGVALTQVVPAVTLINIFTNQ